jgi:hypothetical protein
MRREELVPYVGGPLEGGYTSFPGEGLVLDGVYDECPIPAGTNQAERYVLRRVGDGWGLRACRSRGLTAGALMDSNTLRR